MAQTQVIDFRSGTVTVMPEPEPPLDEIKALLCDEIDAEAEVERLRISTPGAGQAREYVEVLREAVRHLDTNGLGNYPMLQASVDAGEAASLDEAGELIRQRDAVDSLVLAEIRRKRLAGKRAVRAAATADAARAARAAVVWS